MIKETSETAPKGKAKPEEEVPQGEPAIEGEGEPAIEGEGEEAPKPWLVGDRKPSDER